MHWFVREAHSARTRGDRDRLEEAPLLSNRDVFAVHCGSPARKIQLSPDEAR